MSKSTMLISPLLISGATMSIILPNVNFPGVEVFSRQEKTTPSGVLVLQKMISFLLSPFRSPTPINPEGPTSKFNAAAKEGIPGVLVFRMIEI
ncbi:MAG TPA: hypothetical protein PLV32_11765, partial [Chitinophagaceae bacterium]|nr:hypothetical protein [Chitinophagaceae bacterium]